MPVKRRAEGKALKCKACERDAAKRDFCLVHLEAYEKMVEKYVLWAKALKTSWREYLSEIEQNPLTGEWIREVASYLINNEETRNVKEG